MSKPANTIFKFVSWGISIRTNSRQMLRRGLAIALGVALLSGWGMVEEVWGCPNCKDTLQANGFASGYALSILLLLSMPFCILGGWVVAIVRLRSRRQRPPQEK